MSKELEDIEQLAGTSRRCCSLVTPLALTRSCCLLRILSSCLSFWCVNRVRFGRRAGGRRRRRCRIGRQTGGQVSKTTSRNSVFLWAAKAVAASAQSGGEECLIATWTGQCAHASTRSEPQHSHTTSQHTAQQHSKKKKKKKKKKKIFFFDFFSSLRDVISVACASLVRRWLHVAKKCGESQWCGAVRGQRSCVFCAVGRRVCALATKESSGCTCLVRERARVCLVLSLSARFFVDQTRAVEQSYSMCRAIVQMVAHVAINSRETTDWNEARQMAVNNAESSSARQCKQQLRQAERSA